MEKSCRKKNKENKLPKETLSQNDTKKKVSNLLGKAEGLMEALNFEEAGKACEKALKLDPSNCEALEMRASAAIEISQIEIALLCLDKAISIAPFSGFQKYLSRAQLSTGEESLYFYNKGIELIKVELGKCPVKPKSSVNKMEAMDVDGDSSEVSKTEEETKFLELTHSLSTVFCNIAELYITDLCDEEDAQEFCKAAILNAIETQPDNPEPYVMKARYEIILGDNESALQSILKSTIHWFPKINLELDAQVDMPSASVRHNTAKVLIELKQHSEAHVVLETLIQEDDEDSELWYLMGWNSFLEGESGHETAKECLVKARKVDHWFPCEDEDMLHHIDELLGKLGVSPQDIDFEAVSDDEYEDIEEDEELENEIIEAACNKNGE